MPASTSAASQVGVGPRAVGGDDVSRAGRGRADFERDLVIAEREFDARSPSSAPHGAAAHADRADLGQVPEIEDELGHFAFFATNAEIRAVAE